MKFQLSVTGLDRVKTRWEALKREQGWTEERLCTEASKFAAPGRDWDKLYFDGVFADNCAPATFTHFLRRKFIREEGFIAFCHVLNIDYLDVIEAENLLPVPIWVGRETLQRDLLEKLTGNCRVLVLAGITGIGKTALADRLTGALIPEGFSNEIPIDFDIVHQLENARSISKTFIDAAIRLLQRVDRNVTATQFTTPEQLLDQLVDNLVNHRRLIRLDSVERLLQGEENGVANRFIDPMWCLFFQKILNAPDCASRIIITSQDQPEDLASIDREDLCHIQSLEGLNEGEVYQLFQQAFERDGLDFIFDGFNRARLKYIGELYEGHPLVLRLIAGDILERFQGNIGSFWEENKARFQKIKQIIDEGKNLEEKELNVSNFYRINLISKQFKKVLEDEIEMAINRLKKTSDRAYKLLLYSSVYLSFQPKEAWWYTLSQCNLDYDDGDDNFTFDLCILFNRYLVDTREMLPTDQPWIKQHNLIRNVAHKHLLGERKTAG